MKTLKQLWDEVGGPFWASVIDRYGGIDHYILGRNPVTGQWHTVVRNGSSGKSLHDDSRVELTSDPTKIKYTTKEQEPLRVWARSDTKTLVVSETNPKIGADEWTDITAELARALLPELKRLEQE